MICRHNAISSFILLFFYFWKWEVCIGPWVGTNKLSHWKKPIVNQMRTKATAKDLILGRNGLVTGGQMLSGLIPYQSLHLASGTPSPPCSKCGPTSTRCPWPMPLHRQEEWPSADLGLQPWVASRGRMPMGRLPFWGQQNHSIHFALFACFLFPLWQSPTGKKKVTFLHTAKTRVAFSVV